MELRDINEIEPKSLGFWPFDGKIEPKIDINKPNINIQPKIDLIKPAIAIGLMFFAYKFFTRKKG